MTRTTIVAWIVGVLVSFGAYAGIMAPFYKGGADPRYVLVQAIALGLCPASFAWVQDGQWSYVNEWPLLFFVPVMNGLVYSSLAAVIIDGWRRHRWLARVTAAAVVGWWVLVVVDYERWMQLIRSGAAEC